jgi:YidC/Oxa1 family membrane protein insertase
MLQDDLRREICPEKQPAPPAEPVVCGEGGDASFFFIPDLTDKATGTVLITLIVLYIGSQLLSTLLMSTTTDRTQRMIFLALPFFFVIFIINFPAGLLVYWITTNLWTIVQQAIIRKRLGPMRPPGQEGMGLGELFKGGGGGGPGPPAPATAGGSDGNPPKGRPSGPPPAPPRRKKKRSGRRR